ncbi:sensor histidine kinase [Arthrobacter crystallopoietes]|uniref:sensor histidine kinase n=1 Tax=Crystallibacter crystallopoietes TaxID=37928 RepID=UPI00130545FE|nr:histidine kinase [Arthrobacter crystallopoietes]
MMKKRPAWIPNVVLVLLVSSLDVLLSLMVIGIGLEDGTVPYLDETADGSGMLGWARYAIAPVLAAFGGPLLLLRRRWPRTTTVAAAALSVVSLSGVAYLVALFQLARRRLDLWVPVLILAYVGLEALLGAEPMTWDVALVAVLLLGGVAVWGAYRGQRRRLLVSLRERAELAEAERAAEAERSRLHERHRIAREMHDTLAHRMSLVAVQAGALQVDAPDTETANAAQLMRRTAHDALVELREVLGVLRNGTADAGREPAAGLDALPVLADDWRAAGVELTVVVNVPAHTVVLDAVERAVYRLVQEGLTNAARHAPESRVEVRVDAADNVLTVEVESTGGAAADPIPGAGLGLIGLDERVRLLGGTLTYGPTTAGYRLVAHLPLGSATGDAA